MAPSDKDHLSSQETLQADTTEPIRIQMLGDFVLRYQEQSLSGENVRAKQVWTLLEYILANRNKEISMDKLCNVLWGDDAIEDPANALKNLAYRLRTILKKTLVLPDNNTIIFKHGAYIWNPQVHCIIDADQFEDYCQKGLTEQDNISEQQRLNHLRKALSVYKGGFLPQSAYKDWVVPLSIYYQRLYMSVVEKCCNILLQQHQYKEVEEISTNAIAIDPFTESNHALLIKALVASNNQKKAKQHYQSVREMFRDELGVEPSELITKLYENVINSHIAFEKDIAVVKKDLKEAIHATSALCCSYEMFKMIYRLQARTILRTKQTVCIMLLSAETIDALPDKEWENFMEKTKLLMAAALRKNDVVCRYGKTQFLVMLSEITYENTIKVLRRIVDKINCSEQLQAYHITINGQATNLDPVEIEQNDK